MAGIDLKELKLGDILSNHLRFTNKVKDFVKERSDLEREFAKRLESLVKRYTSKKALKEEISSAQVLSEEKSSEWSSTSNVWEKLLNDTMEQSKLHGNLADTLVFAVTDKLKALSVRKEESRKKHLLFYAKYKSEFDRYVADLQKCKLDYDAACDSVEAAKGRYERATDERTKIKLKRLWHQDILDMNNQRNVYLLTLNMVNNLLKRQEQVEIPEILKQFENFGTSCNISILKIWNGYIDVQQNMHRKSLDILDKTKNMVELVDPSSNTSITLPPSFMNFTPFSYEPCGLWTDNGELVKDEYSVVYLGNKLDRLRKTEAVISQDITRERIGMEGLEKLYQSFIKNPQAGNAELIMETMIEEKRTIFMAQLEQFKYQFLIDSIVSNIGEFPKESTMHQFKSSSFAIPASCDYCHQTIWGVSIGLTCKECRFNCHVKCEMKVAPTCSGVKGVIRGLRTKKSRSVSDPHRKAYTNNDDSFEHEKSSILDDSMVRNDTKASLRISQDTIIHQEKQVDTTVKEAIKETKIKETIKEKPPSNEKTPPIQTKNESVVKEKVAVIEEEKTTLSVGCLAQVLYDYFATNPEEVNIHEGEHVIVVKTDDGLGWTVVSKSGITGMVPTTYIRALASESSQQTLHLKALDKHDHGFGTCLYPYTKSSDDELSVLAGDAVKIMQEDDGSGWILVTKDGAQGLVPAAYVIKFS